VEIIGTFHQQNLNGLDFVESNTEKVCDITSSNMGFLALQLPGYIPHLDSREKKS
jgi:hypothetical protein